MLVGGEEGVVFGEGGVLDLPRLFHCRHAAGEFLLEGEGWQYISRLLMSA